MSISAGSLRCRPRVEVDKGQVLPLLGREGFCRRTDAGHPIQLFVRASNEEPLYSVLEAYCDQCKVAP